MSKYSLDIISHHSDFKNKTLKQYKVDGINTIGAYGNEPFEIRFKNHTSQKLQVKVSLDGTDILTGKPADTTVNENMWFVDSYGTLSLKAWPETSNGGAQFIFTHADKSVALHTHGDLSHKGIIAVAVYVEGEKPQRIKSRSDEIREMIGEHNRISESSFRRSAKYDSLEYNDISESSPSAAGLNDSLDSSSRGILREASVGAGQYVNQKISYVDGLKKPLLEEIIKLKYMWWDSLKEKLDNQVKQANNHPSGFPGDDNKEIMSLGNTPRINIDESKSSFDRV